MKTAALALCLASVVAAPAALAADSPQPQPADIACMPNVVGDLICLVIFLLCPDCTAAPML
jgi:hypothetical protein